MFGVLVGHLILRHTDNLNKALHAPKLSASEGRQIAAMTVVTLQSLRNDSHFDMFWRGVELTRLSLDVEEPQMPRKRNVSRRFEDGTAEAVFFTDCQQYYRQQFYEALDLIVNSIKGRFNQPGCKTYKNLEDLLLKAVKKGMKTVFLCYFSLWG